MTIKPVRFSHDLVNFPVARIEGICVATKRVTLQTVLVDVDKDGKILNASRVSYKFVRALDPKRTEEYGDAVYALHISGVASNTPAFGIFAKDQIFHYHYTSCPLQYLVRDPEFKVRAVWKGLE